MRRVAILGSTGSIGSQALEVIAAHPERFSVTALAANTSIVLLAKQANIFRPRVVSAGSKELAESLRARLDYQPERVAFGTDGLRAAALDSGAQQVLAATDGMAGLGPVLGALERGIDVALSNKELAVAAGELLFAAAQRSGARLVPVDSEHSAVFQCLAGERLADVTSIVLTASGGPFWDLSLEELERVTPEQALRHPTWRMGPKNTIDSATLMNKGLEVIEASHFFGLPGAKIEVVVHRQSIAHAFVFFGDGSVKAQLAWPDMRVPIGYALSYPERLPALGRGQEETRRSLGLDGKKATLSFEPVDESRFPSLKLCYRTLERGQTYPAVLSAANEEAGRAFLQGKVKFTDICALVERALERHQASNMTLEAVEEADRWSRAATNDLIAAIA